jgi:hypothetical protein
MVELGSQIQPISTLTSEFGSQIQPISTLTSEFGSQVVSDYQIRWLMLK